MLDMFEDINDDDDNDDFDEIEYTNNNNNNHNEDDYLEDDIHSELSYSNNYHNHPHHIFEPNDIQKLHEIIMQGLGLTKIPDTKNMNISHEEYTKKYNLYLDKVRKREKSELQQWQKQEQQQMHLFDRINSSKKLYSYSAATSENKTVDFRFRRRRKRNIIKTKKTIDSNINNNNDDDGNDNNRDDDDDMDVDDGDDTDDDYHKAAAAASNNNNNNNNDLVYLRFHLSLDELEPIIDESTLRFMIKSNPSSTIGHHQHRPHHHHHHQQHHHQHHQHRKSSSMSNISSSSSSSKQTNNHFDGDKSQHESNNDDNNSNNHNHNHNHNNNNNNNDGREKKGEIITKEHYLTLKIYQLIEPYQRKLLDTKRIDLSKAFDGQKSLRLFSNWMEFDVHRAITSWQKQGGNFQNLGFIIHCDGCEKYNLHIVHDLSPYIDAPELSPILNIIGKMIHREKRSRQHRHSVQQQHQQQSAHSTRLSGRRTTRRPPECSKQNNQRCCRHNMDVVFKEIKGFEFIIQPKNFDAGYCRGKCPPRYNPAHHHAVLQSLIWKKDKTKVPRPCCAPSKLVELEVLHVDESDNSKLKVSNWSDMRVLECACS